MSTASIKHRVLSNIKHHLVRCTARVLTTVKPLLTASPAQTAAPPLIDTRYSPNTRDRRHSRRRWFCFRQGSPDSVQYNRIRRYVQVPTRTKTPFTHSSPIPIRISSHLISSPWPLDAAAAALCHPEASQIPSVASESESKSINGYK